MYKPDGKLFLIALIIALAMVSFPAGASPRQHGNHHTGVNVRGDKAMGFSHEKTTHHFLLLKDGGVIDVSARDAKDTASRDQIRMHLAHIAKMFAEGNFNIPMFIHDRNPPGATLMQEKKAQIKYQFEETEKGGRVRISTTDDKALSAIHDFLRFQIADHKTGDSLEIRF